MLTIGTGNGSGGNFQGVIANNTSGTGTVALTKTGSGSLTLSGANTYSGGTTVSNGTLTLSGSGTLGATSAALTVSGGTLALGGTTQTAGTVTISGGTISGSGSLTGSSFAGQSGTVSSVLAGSGIALTKTTTGTLTLTGANTYSGATTVSAGTLTLNNSGGAAIGAGSIAINAGTLTFGSANQIAAGLNTTLGGGTLNLGNFASSNVLGTLSMGASSIIDFGGSTGTAIFGDSSSITWTGTLTLSNFVSGTSAKFGTTATGLTGTQLSQIAATNFSGFGLDSSGFLTASAVPEPSTYAAIFGAGALLGVGLKRRREKQPAALALTTTL